MQVTQSVDQIELIDRQIYEVESEMENIMLGLDSVIITIPGIGYINGGMILGEIGDIHRFASPNQLLAFAGLDPSVYQSGNFSASHTRMSKHGSRALRYALINAAHNVVKTMRPLSCTTIKRSLKAGLTTMPLGTVPTSSSESSIRCLLTIRHSISSKF